MKHLAAVCTIMIFAAHAWCAERGIFSVTPTQEKTVQAETVQQNENIRASFSIATNTRDIAVFVNGEYMGTAPLIIRNLTAGLYQLTLKKAGYVTREFFVELEEGKEKNYYIEMQRSTGYIAVQTNPENALITIDGIAHKTATGIEGSGWQNNFFELEEGIHTLEVRAFGYATEKRTITVAAETRETLNITLKAAPFELTGFSASSARFNPKNPGALGRTVFSIRVTAGGNARIVVLSDSGTEIRRFEKIELTDWNTAIVWDGRDAEQTIVPDGVYRVTVTAASTSNTNGANTSGAASPVSLETSIAVDSTLSYPLSEAPLTEISVLQSFTQLLPTRTYQAGFSVSPVWSIAGTETANNLYDVPLSFRFASTPVANFAYALNATLHFGNHTQTPFAFRAGAEYVFHAGAIDYGVLARYGYLNATVGSADVSGAKLDSGSGLAFGIFAGTAFSALGGELISEIASEVVFGGERGILDGNSAIRWKNNIAFIYRKTFFSVTIGAGLRSAFAAPDGKAVSWAELISAGGKFSFLIPATKLVLSTGIETHISAKTVYLSPAIGLSLFF